MTFAAASGTLGDFMCLEKCVQDHATLSLGNFRRSMPETQQEDHGGGPLQEQIVNQVVIKAFIKVC
jgi:hypothetical protein